MNDTGKFKMNISVHYNFGKKKLDYKVTALEIHHISPIAKYVIEKYDTALIGRQVSLGHISINALDGSVNLVDLKVYEAHSDKIFFGCHDIFVKLNLDKMFSGVYGIDTIRIVQPQINIVQNGNTFNFTDIVKRFTKDTSQKHPDSTAPVPYSIRNVSISKGTVSYLNVPVHNSVAVNNINFNLPEISWNKPESQAHLDFEYGKGGTFNIDADADFKSLDYSINLVIDKYDLSQYYTPLTKFLAISSLQGFLSSDLMITGKFKDPKAITAVGDLTVTDFEMKDSTRQKVFAVGQMDVDIDTIDVKQGIYSINNILMDRPFMRFDYYTNGNNISQLLKYNSSSSSQATTSNPNEVKADYSNIFALLASSIKMVAANFSNSNYHTDSIVIRNGQFVFNDYTLNTLFHYNVSKINLITNEISAKSKNIAFNASATLNDTGDFSIYANVSLDLKNMLFDYNMAHVRIADFNPYMEYYMATPFLGGYMDYKSTDSVINRNLKSTNFIHIAGLEAGKKTSSKPVYDIPVRTAVALLKDGKGNIDLNLPANGNLDDPNYKIGKIIWPTIADLLKKAVSSPFKLLAKALNRDPEAMKQMNIAYMRDKLEEKELHKLEDILAVLKMKKELNVEIVQVIDSVEEKYELALEMARRAIL